MPDKRYVWKSITIGLRIQQGQYLPRKLEHFAAKFIKLAYEHFGQQSVFDGSTNYPYFCSITKKKRKPSNKKKNIESSNPTCSEKIPKRCQRILFGLNQIYLYLVQRLMSFNCSRPRVTDQSQMLQLKILQLRGHIIPLQNIPKLHYFLKENYLRKQDMETSALHHQVQNVFPFKHLTR